MVRKFTSIAFAGALMLSAAPAFAQDIGGAVNGITAIPGQLVGGMGQGLGIDLDPFHIFTPAPQPAMAAPMGEPTMRRHRMMRHPMHMRHNGMKYHHKMMMMHKHKMMKQKHMMKSERMMMKKDAMKK